MLLPMNHVVIHLFCGRADMRWGYDRLAGLCKELLQLDPYSGQLFFFVNRQRNRAKIFYYDGTGCCLFSKRLEIGTFRITNLAEGTLAVTISASELMLLLAGQEIRKSKPTAAWLPTSKRIDE